MADAAHEVLDVPERSRYELRVDGELAGIADYRERDGDAEQGRVLVFPHTEIDASRRGQGLGEVLVRGAMDDVRAKGAKVVPACWFVAEFLEQHAEYADLRA